MFSFSDYVRKLAREAALAGFYDALEILEARVPEEQAEAAERFLGKCDPPPRTPVLPAAPTPPKSGPTPASPTPTPPTPPTPIPTPTPAHGPPGESLDSRKRGRPPKFPDGHS